MAGINVTVLFVVLIVSTYNICRFIINLMPSATVGIPLINYFRKVYVKMYFVCYCCVQML